MQTHLKTHQGEYQFHCDICPGRYKTEKTLRDHITKKHMVEEYEEVEEVDEVQVQ